MPFKVGDKIKQINTVDQFLYIVILPGIAVCTREITNRNLKGWKYGTVKGSFALLKNVFSAQLLSYGMELYCGRHNIIFFVSNMSVCDDKLTIIVTRYQRIENEEDWKKVDTSR